MLTLQEADFFYVPIYTSCFIFPVRDHADYPWFYSVCESALLWHVCRCQNADLHLGTKPDPQIPTCLISFWSIAASVHNRAQGSTNMQLEAWHWLRSHLPYWDRRGGRDHIWVRSSGHLILLMLCIACFSFEESCWPYSL